MSAPRFAVGDRVVVSDTSPIFPGGHGTVTERLPRHDYPYDYRVAVDNDPWTLAPNPKYRDGELEAER